MVVWPAGLKKRLVRSDCFITTPSALLVTLAAPYIALCLVVFRLDWALCVAHLLGFKHFFFYVILIFYRLSNGSGLSGQLEVWPAVFLHQKTGRDGGRLLRGLITSKFAIGFVSGAQTFAYPGW
jgi:hypothetical protein